MIASQYSLLSSTSFLFMISIGLPAFKATYLEGAINSVLKQTYTDFELIIVNDASPENVEEVVYSFRDNRIRYYKNEENLGQTSVVKNWNKCLEYARGEYFVLFSDDDVYESDFLKRMVQMAEKFKDVNLFHCRVRQIDNKGKTINYSPTCPEYEDISDFIWHRLKGFRLQYVTDFFCRTSALRSVGGFYDLPMAWGSDDITWYLIAKGNGVVYSPEILCNWRFSDINISSIGNLQKRIEALNKMYDFLNDFVQTINTPVYNKWIFDDIVKWIPLRKEKSIENLIESNIKNLSVCNIINLKLKKHISTFTALRILIKKI